MVTLRYRWIDNNNRVVVKEKEFRDEETAMAWAEFQATSAKGDRFIGVEAVSRPYGSVAGEDGR